MIFELLNFVHVYTSNWALGWEDPLEEDTATHSSIFVWGIPWTVEPSRLQPIGLQRVRHYCSDLACIHLTRHTMKLREDFENFTYIGLVYSDLA